MTYLPTVTVVAVTSREYAFGKTVEAIIKTLEQVDPCEVILFTDGDYEHERIKVIEIDPIKSLDDYSKFMFKELAKYVHTDHILVIQHDGYVLDGNAWKEEFLEFDYIGAPWGYRDGRNVGNGGFSLRSRKLHEILMEDEFNLWNPEDDKICRYYRESLEARGIVFAPEELAHEFSFEMHRPVKPTFGFHNNKDRYREPIIIRRTGAMGDVIMMEPVMHYFHEKGYRVIIDTLPHFYNLFAKHYYPVEHISFLSENYFGYRRIDLDMAYEVNPKQLALSSYYNVAGITDAILRNSKLMFRATNERKDVKLFDKYVVLHTDDTAMTHRNVHGVDWDEVASYIQVFLGHPVFRVGRGNGTGGLKINTYSENMLAYIIANCDYFIGIDSGCGQMAVANEVPSMLFFGSVDPALRYPELDKITVMQKKCPIEKDGCYHSLISVSGTDCEVDVKGPPCIKWKTSEVIKEVKKFIV